MKPATQVNAAVLAAAVHAVEAAGPLPSMGQLHAAVCVCYNDSDDIPASISPSIVAARLRELKIETKTQPAKRKSSGGGNMQFPVDMSRMLAVIAAVEKRGPLDNLTTLYEVVAERYNKKVPECFHVTPAIVGARIKESGIELRTKGRKGRAKGSKIERETFHAADSSLLLAAIVELCEQGGSVRVRANGSGYDVSYPKGRELSLTSDSGEGQDTADESLGEAA